MAAGGWNLDGLPTLRPPDDCSGQSCAAAAAAASAATEAAEGMSTLLKAPEKEP